MKRIYIIKAGTTFAGIVDKFGDFETWIASYIGDFPGRVIDMENGHALPAAEECAGVIITGSHAMVTEELPWSLRLEAYIRELVKAQIPLLGICYGHQLIAKSLGGVVDYHPGGMELGSVALELNGRARDDAIFKHLPERFNVHVVHAQSVLSLPEGAILLASNAFEKHHAFKIEPATWAVQFHPEYDEAIMKAYIGEVLNDAPEKRKGLLCAVTKAEASNRIIPLFVQVVRRREEAAGAFKELP